MDPLLEYACKRVIELEGLLLVEVSETVWPAEVGMVYGQVENAGDLPAHHQRRLKLKWHTEFGHLNRGDMLTSEQHRCSNEKKKFQRRV